MTEKGDRKIFVIDKDNKFWAQPLNHNTSIGLNKFYKSYIWYIVFLLLWGFMFFRERNLRTYKYPETIMAIVGLFCGIIILAFFDYFESYAPKLTFDKDSHKLFQEKHFSAIEKDRWRVLLKDKIGLNKNKSVDMNIYDSNYLNKIMKENKITTISYSDWIDQHNNIHDVAMLPETTEGNLWAFGSMHLEYTTILLLTMSFMMAVWNRDIFHKMFTWISITLAIELFVGATWWVVRSYHERSNLLFFIKRSQIIVSNLSITTMLIFMGLAYKK